MCWTHSIHPSSRSSSLKTFDTLAKTHPNPSFPLQLRTRTNLFASPWQAHKLHKEPTLHRCQTAENQPNTRSKLIKLSRTVYNTDPYLKRHTGKLCDSQLLWQSICFWVRYSKRRSLGVSPSCRVRSKLRWFTEFCNSQLISRFAAFFIVMVAEVSTAKRCTKLRYMNYFIEYFRLFIRWITTRRFILKKSHKTKLLASLTSF